MTKKTAKTIIIIICAFIVLTFAWHMVVTQDVLQRYRAMAEAENLQGEVHLNPLTNKITLDVMVDVSATSSDYLEFMEVERIARRSMTHGLMGKGIKRNLQERSRRAFDVWGILIPFSVGIETVPFQDKSKE